MNVLITGSKGFIGKNLQTHLSERDDIAVQYFDKGMSEKKLKQSLKDCNFVFHLAGINRPKTDDEFVQGNTTLTKRLCDLAMQTGRKIPILYTSSIQAEEDNAYGKSKLAAEEALDNYAEKSGAKIYNCRLPNVFGKWAKPNYNSAVATFCHNISHGLSIQINDSSALIRLVYVDDVVHRFVAIMDGAVIDNNYFSVDPVYEITVEALVEKLNTFKSSRGSLIVERVGTGLDRALYSTYLSYLEPKQFSYDLVKHEDPRGVFVEMLKTKDSGQFSYFTAHPGITRGGHYHHTKTEKFLVLKGEAIFKFRHVVTDEVYQLSVSGDKPTIVETVPGWTHDVTNIGDHEMIVMLWANEIFDREAPDTYAKPL